MRTAVISIAMRWYKLESQTESRFKFGIYMDIWSINRNERRIWCGGQSWIGVGNQHGSGSFGILFFYTKFYLNSSTSTPARLKCPYRAALFASNNANTTFKEDLEVRWGYLEICATASQHRLSLTLAALLWLYFKAKISSAIFSARASTTYQYQLF